MQQTPIFTTTRQAAVPIPANTFIGLNDQPCAAGAVAWGITDYDAAASQAVAVKVLGTSKVRFGAGGLQAGALVMSDAVGRAVAVANGGAAVARVIAPASAAEGVGEVLLLPSSAAA